MPGIDGWQFCQLLRSPEYPRFNRVPILVVSATFSGSDAEQLSIDLGADAFLAAPFAPSALQQYATRAAQRAASRPGAARAGGPSRPGRGGSVARRLRRPAATRSRWRSTGAAALRAWHDAASGRGGDRRPAARPVRRARARPRSRSRARAPSRSPSAATRPADAALTLARQGADGSLPAPADPARLISLCETVRRQRSLLRIEELLEERGRALRDSEARWRSLFEAIPEIVVVHDDAGVIRHINQTGAERLEWPAHDLIGRNLAEFERRRRAAASAAAQPRTARRRQLSRACTSRAAGATIPVEVNRRRMTFEGQPAVLSVARDVSARHELGAPAAELPRHADPRHQEPARHRARLHRAARRDRRAERRSSAIWWRAWRRTPTPC